MIVRIFVGYANSRTAESALFRAIIFGTISPKIRIMNVMTTVEITEATPSLFTDLIEIRSCIVTTVAAVDAAMFARLLPIRIAESAVVKSSLILYARAADLLPASAAFFRRILFDALNEISDAEKKAERTTISAIMRICLIICLPPPLRLLRQEGG